MPLRLVKDYKRVLLLSMSWWAQILGLFALIVPEVLFGVYGIETDPYMLWNIGIGLGVFGAVARPIQQSASKLVNWIQIIAIAGLIVSVSYVFAQAEPVAKQKDVAYTQTMEVAVPLIAKYEGKRNQAYLDIVGVPTICYGSTRGITLGMYMTDEQCMALLQIEVAEYRERLHQYFTSDTKKFRLTPHRDAAFVSLAYNIGVSGAGNSTAVNRLNYGDIKGACNAITWWNKAGQRVIRGLVVRRAGEYELCMLGVV